MAGLVRLGYADAMSQQQPPNRPEETADLVGLPADQLDHLLGEILDRPAEPPRARPLTVPHCQPEEPSFAPPELPAAFAGGGDPYRLEDLLSGLPPAPPDAHDDETFQQAPPPVQSGGWLDHSGGIDPTPDVLPQIAQAESTPPPPGDDLRAADPGAAMEAVLDVALAPPARPAAPMDDDSNDVPVTLAPSAVAPDETAVGQPQADDAWDPSVLTHDSIVSALQALAEPPPLPLPANEDQSQRPSDELLVLTDEFLAATARASGDLHIPPAPPNEDIPTVPAEPEQDLAASQLEAPAQDEIPSVMPSPPPAISDSTQHHETGLRDTIATILAANRPHGAMSGETDLPGNTEALSLLLTLPPHAQDFSALDALYACWPRATQDCRAQALLAVAYSLTTHFGLPDKLPMASAKAWRMLSAGTFESDMAQRLEDVDTFIAEWQKTQRTFLILEFGEIELIEHLFESLPPADHIALLTKVMNFKVLSNRRMGLLRRIPGRVKKQITPMLPTRKDDAMAILVQHRALLEHIADPSGFAPIVETATKMREEIEKLMKAVASIGAPPPAAGGGVPLGHIG